jgi:hypothetical protein
VRLITDSEFVASKAKELLVGAPKRNPLAFERAVVVYAVSDAGEDVACLTDCDGDTGGVFSFGSNVATIKKAIAHVAGEILDEGDVKYQKPKHTFDILA